MTLEEIKKNKSFAYHVKKNELQKSNFSNVDLATASKAFSNENEKVEVLVYETNISKQRNEFMFNQYLNGWVLNHSTGMKYIKLYLCINSNVAEDASELDNWNKYYPFVINKDEADKHGYFWAVKESKYIEASSVVYGSNFLTPVLDMKVIDENTIRVKLAINVCGIMDSHRDVHIKGCWNKTMNENVYDLLIQEHEMEQDSIIADSINDDLKVYTEDISVKELLSKFSKKEAVKPNTSENIEPSYDTQTEDKKRKLFIN
jgi:hypothetical protein